MGAAWKAGAEKAVIATKVGANHLSPEGIVSACEESLKNLKTDYIDLYQIHWPNHDIPIETTWHALEGLLTDGKVRALGVSNFAIGDLSDLIEVGRPETNQMPYSLLWRALEFEILARCREQAIGLICYSPLAQGLLTGNVTLTADEVPDGLARSRWYSSTRPMANHDESGCEEAVFRAIAGIRHLSRQLGAPMASVALAWVRQQRGVTSFLVGARNPKSLTQPADAFSGAGRRHDGGAGAPDTAGQRCNRPEPGYVDVQLPDAVNAFIARSFFCDRRKISRGCARMRRG